MQLSEKSSKTSQPKTNEEPILLIDADLYLYRCCAAAEEETDWGDDLWSLSIDLKEAKRHFRELLKEFCEYLRTDDFILCLTDGQNFRKDLDPNYKSGRRKVRKPVGYKAFVDWAKEEYRWYSAPYCEADDVMGILATAPGSKAVIVSDDKDMKTLPAKVYRPTSGELLEINEDQANYAFYTQCLTGDPTDGYYGIKGVGPVAATKILGRRPDWSLVENHYMKKGMTKDDALLQARLARILRWSDWDHEKSIIKLWEPRR